MIKSKYWDAKFLRFKNLYYPRILVQEKDKKFIELIKNINGKRVLKTDLFEEAHGNENLLFEIRKKNYGVGIDISKKVIMSSKTYQRNYLLIIADVSKLPFKDESFDTIISTSTIDHLVYSDVVNSFNELNRTLKKTGIIFLTLDNYHNILYRIEFIFWKFFNLYYRLKCFKIDEIIELARKSNLKIKNLESIMVFPPILDKILILFQNLSKVNLNKIYNGILKYAIKLSKGYKYTSGRFIFIELKKR